MGMSSASWKLLVASCIVSTVAFLLHIVAFSTREWVVAGSNSPFRSIGFHEACFDNCRHPYCRTNGEPDVAYDGCWKVYDYYFHEIRSWLQPPWLRHTRDMSGVMVPVLFVCVILTVVSSCLLFRSRDTTDYSRRRRAGEVIILGITWAMLFISGLLGVAVVATFSVHAFDADWMPISDKNRFGYSFWLEVCVASLSVVACFAALVAAVFKLLKKNSLKALSYSQEFHLRNRY